MSKPIRYGLADTDLGRIHPQADGHLVMWADYAALAAENERLRKAGDDVVSKIEVCSQNLWCAIHRWNAAKEGGDAK